MACYWFLFLIFKFIQLEQKIMMLFFFFLSFFFFCLQSWITFASWLRRWGYGKYCAIKIWLESPVGKRIKRLVPMWRAHIVMKDAFYLFHWNLSRVQAPRNCLNLWRLKTLVKFIWVQVTHWPHTWSFSG